MTNPPRPASDPPATPEDQQARIASVWLVMEGEYESSVRTVHASEASAKAWVVAEILDSLKDRLKTDLKLADDAAERREVRRVHRENVAKTKAGDTSDSDYYVYEEPVLDALASAQAAAPSPCEWRRLPLSDSFQPDCEGENFDAARDEYDLKGWRFCPYCGKSLVLAEVPHV